MSSLSSSLDKATFFNSILVQRFNSGRFLLDGVCLLLLCVRIIVSTCFMFVIGRTPFIFSWDFSPSSFSVILVAVGFPDSVSFTC